MFPPPQRGPADVILADEFELYGPTAATPDRWWESFNSAELNALAEEALADNFTLKEALARIEQAVALARQNRSVLYPEVGYVGEAGLTSTHRDAGFDTIAGPSILDRLDALETILTPPTGGGTPEDNLRELQARLAALETAFTPPPDNNQTINTESYRLGVTAGYEVDLWGRLRADVQTAELDLATTREDLYASMQTVVGQVVLTWLDIQQARQTLDVTRAQLETNETVLELIEFRFRKGLANALDVFQQRQIIAQTESIIPPLEAQNEVLMHSLAVLLGDPPRTELDIGPDEFPDPGPLPEYGVPADLLARRPDVRAAGLQLRAADWQVSAARADRLPQLTLTSAFTFNGDDVDVLFDNWIATLASSVTGPIFDAGRRKAEVDRTRAVVDQQLSRYRMTVLTAMAEVENALVQIDRQVAYIEALHKQYDAEKNTLSEASNRYRKGLSDYLPVLAALTATQQLERTLIGADHDLLVLRVQLHLALGGDWMEVAASDMEETEEQG
jgi:NodT family efflux transporter outer membrane factor (OMF) lipoprotein